MYCLCVWVHTVSLFLVDRSDRGLGGADPVRGYPRAALSIWPYGPRRAPSEALHAADDKYEEKAEEDQQARENGDDGR